MIFLRANPTQSNSTLLFCVCALSISLSSGSLPSNCFAYWAFHVEWKAHSLDFVFFLFVSFQYSNIIAASASPLVHHSATTTTSTTTRATTGTRPAKLMGTKSLTYTHPLTRSLIHTHTSTLSKARKYKIFKKKNPHHFTLSSSLLSTIHPALFFNLFFSPFILSLNKLLHSPAHLELEHKDTFGTLHPNCSLWKCSRWSSFSHHTKFSFGRSLFWPMRPIFRWWLWVGEWLSFFLPSFFFLSFLEIRFFVASLSAKSTLFPFVAPLPQLSTNILLCLCPTLTTNHVAQFHNHRFVSWFSTP